MVIQRFWIADGTIQLSFLISVFLLRPLALDLRRPPSCLSARTDEHLGFLLFIRLERLEMFVAAQLRHTFHEIHVD